MSRCGVLSALLCLIASNTCALGQQPPPGGLGAIEPDPPRLPVPTPAQLQEYESRSRAMALASRVPFANPPEIHSGDGVLQTTLIATYGHNRIGDDRVYLRSYNGFLVGPTLRVQPNDRLAVRLLNDLPTEHGMPTGHNINIPPHGSNTTNFHAHGLHASPEDNSDNPFLEIPPNGRQDFDIRLGTANSADFAVRAHPPGTHWYHPHKHGSAAIQLGSGMSGALIVEGGLDEVAEIKAARERIFVFQQIPYSDANPGTLEGKAGFMRIRDWSRMTDRFTTINGLLKPVVELAPKEVERWRFIHAGLSARLNLALLPIDGGQAGIDWHEVAVDGIAFGRIDRREEIELTCGGSSDVLIQAPDEPGEYLLVKLADPLARLTNDPGVGTGTPADAVARVVVRGPARPMALPDSQSLQYLAPYRDIEAVQTQRTITLGGEGGAIPRWLVDDKQFNAHQTDLCPIVGSCEEWTIKSTNQVHPFHIHVNAFQVLSLQDKDGRELLTTPGVWRDTVLIDEFQTLRLRIRFEDFTGKTVLHCHKLDHEDQGMMKLVRILAAAPDDRAAVRERRDPIPDNPARAAPTWRLPDVRGVMHESREFFGKPVVLVFFRGMDCPHCVEQLRALAERWKELDAAQVAVVAIGSEPWEPAGAGADDDSKWPFLILADGGHEAFKEFGCYRGQPIHGVFAVDRRGQIRWSTVGETPFTDNDRIVEIGKQLD